MSFFRGRFQNLNSFFDVSKSRSASTIAIIRNTYPRPNICAAIPESSKPSPAAAYFSDMSIPDSSPHSFFGMQFVSFPLITDVIAAEHNERAATSKNRIHMLVVSDIIISSITNTIIDLVISLFFCFSVEKYDSDIRGR